MYGTVLLRFIEDPGFRVASPCMMYHGPQYIRQLDP
jgi:hypothetical protein